MAELWLDCQIVAGLWLDCQIVAELWLDCQIGYIDYCLNIFFGEVAGYAFIKHPLLDFHQLGPLGRVGLVVE